MNSDMMNRATRKRVRDVAVLVIFVATTLLLAGGALASEVVDLRIGSHPDFTRVVFELDTPAGYRIERASTSSDTWELVVSIDATSIPRKVQSTKSLIGLVRISPKADRSVAHIELTRDGLSLKEMILANPPRIVLDILAPTDVAKTDKAPASKPPAQATAKQPAAKKPAQVATAKPAPKPAPKPEAKPAPAPKPAAKPAPAPAPAPEPKVTASAKPEASETPAAQREESEAARSQATPPSTDTAPPILARVKSDDAGPAREAGGPTTGMDARGEKKKPAPAARPEPRKSSSTVAQARLAEGTESGSFETLLMAGAGVIAVLFLVLFVMRRRKAKGDDADDEAGPSLDDAGAASDNVNPFSGMASDDEDQPLLGLGDSMMADAPAKTAFEADTDIVEIGGMEEDSDPAEVKEAAPVDTRLGGEQSMDLDTQAISGGAEQSPVIGSMPLQGGNDDVMRMMREFERRISSLETRLDESADARERLERQVAAQTEELRVQRAAIARTQRAVRNLNRPDDEGPTEPALRDPQ